MRTSGVLMPISSLPSPYGIGTFGAAARNFVDFLEKGGQTFWQILPINPTGYGDSPYQSFSTFAGNPYFIDLDELCEEQLLKKEEIEAYEWGGHPAYVDYGTLYVSRYAILRKVYKRFVKEIPDDFESFCFAQKDWLDDFALYMAIKNEQGGKSWMDWEEDLKKHDPKALKVAKKALKEDIVFYKMLQYLFYKQWTALKEYANEHGILIIGDVPIYVSLDSADVWANPDQFMMDDELKPTDVAGCPPDAFSDDGQLWGNPLYRWDSMKEDEYSWWIRRIGTMASLYDVVRIDHFRGFESFYAIPYGDKTAKNGQWLKGPGMDLFNTVKKTLGDVPIIVEDLGLLTPAVKKLLKDSGYPGMKVIQFAFDGTDGDYLPHNYQNHCIVYTGTHDNETTIGWLENASKKVKDQAVKYMRLNKEEGYHWGVMRTAWASPADIAIVPMTDLLGLGNEARINAPSTTGNNWKWRAKKSEITDELAEELLDNMERYFRIPVWDETPAGKIKK